MSMSSSVKFPSAAEPTDTCSQAGANRLKAIIEHYWSERGHKINVTILAMSFHPAMRSTRFDIRSDMINGMPKFTAALSQCP